MSFIEFNTDLQHNKAHLLKAIDQANAKINALLEMPDKTYATFAKAYFESMEDVELFYTMIGHLNSVANNHETQEVYGEVMPVVDEFSLDLQSNVAIYEAFLHIKCNDHGLTPTQQKVVNDALKDFELDGIHLPQDQKDELKRISMRLSELSKDFSQNLIDATGDFELIIEDYQDVKELPKADLEQSKITHNGKECYRFTLQMPSYLAYMTYGKNATHRETLYKAYCTRAPQNEKLIEEILHLRLQKAQLLGFENYAAYSIAFKDAPSPQEVELFLTKMAQKAKTYAVDEFKDLEAFAGQSLAPHDVGYFSEKFKTSLFSINEEEYMPYFEKNAIVGFVFEFLKEAFGLEAKKVQTTTWHESVSVYDFYDGEQCLSRLYLDLENNPQKRGGAWMHNFQTRYKHSDGSIHKASAFVVCNFMPTGEQTPSLLKHDDVVTLFHELGHAIHHLFSQVDEMSVSGVNGIDWDVVEFPSQFLEQFAYDPKVLKQIGVHYETKEPLSDEMIDKLIASKNFHAGLGMVRQCELALFDLLLHKATDGASKVQEILDEIRSDYAVVMPPNYNKFQHGFGHIFAGGYAAGYYSYKWAEVLSAHLYLHNQKHNVLKAYLNEVLHKSASVNMSVLFENTVGQKPNGDALFELYGMQ